MTNETATATVETKPRKPPRPDLTAEELLLIPKINPAYVLNKVLADFIGHDIVEKRKVLLTGHMGCGKTSLFLQLAASISQPVIRVNLNGQTTVSDLVGYNTVIDGNIIWVDGVLTMAVRRGYWIVLDEIDGADAPVLFVLNALAEKDGFLTLKEKGSEIVMPHPSFRMVATANTVGCMEEYRALYQGTNQMNAAFIDRFRVYFVDYLDAQLEAEVLVSTVGCPMKAAKVLVRLANDVRSAFNEELIDRPFSMRALIDLTEMMMRMRKQEASKVKDKMNPNEIIAKAVEMCVYSKVSKRDAQVIGDLVSKISVIE